MPAGRPSTFTKETADRICEEIALGKSMRSVCAQEDLPEIRTVFRWLRTNEEFCQQYARACEERSEAWVEEMTDIADDSSEDYMERQENGKASILVDSDHINRARLRVDTRKWIASKLKPKKYGDRIENRLAGPEGEALKIVVTGIRPTPENSE